MARGKKPRAEATLSPIEAHAEYRKLADEIAAHDRRYRRQRLIVGLVAAGMGILGLAMFIVYVVQGGAL